jgi:2-polyprenyl-3-methyl-5-hydroxy-6-metoxy-1,4-benzoquinol methylase
LGREKNCKGHGIDVSEKAVQLARQNGIRAEVADITQEGFQLSAQYDYIVISEVLEHLPNPEHLVSKLKGRFRKYIIVTIPNTGFAGERLRLLMGKFPRQWVLHPSEHIRFWTVSDFIYWCEQLGFKVERYQGMQEEFYDIKIRIWKYYPRLCSRYVLYLLKEK